jgi:hypothetical protein
MPPDAALPLLGPYSPNEKFGTTQQMPAVMNKKFCEDAQYLPAGWENL